MTCCGIPVSTSHPCPACGKSDACDERCNNCNKILNDDRDCYCEACKPLMRICHGHGFAAPDNCPVCGKMGYAEFGDNYGEMSCPGFDLDFED